MVQWTKKVFGARKRLMVIWGCQQVRWSKRLTWKYDDDCCGTVETE